MKFVMTSASGIPAGNYPAKFVEAEGIENDFGPGVRLTWEVLQGDHQGAKTTRIVSQKLGPKTNLFKFVSALAGRKPEAGEEIDLTAFYGLSGMVIVGDCEGGSTRVESFIRVT